MKHLLFSLILSAAIFAVLPATAEPLTPNAKPAGKTAPLFPKTVKPEDIAKIEIFKARRTMNLLDAKGEILRSYQIVLGWEPVGKKTEEGDGKTPEGNYTIDSRNENSEYHKSLRISYPDADDIAQAKKRHVSPGGMIFIHGKPNFKSWMFWKYNVHKDWTNGCIAVSNTEMMELWNLIAVGTPITINP